MHESCRECQRLNPDVDMTATADDFYASGSMLPPSAEGDGGDDDMGRMPSLSTESDDSDIPPLFKCYNDKRRLCKRDCNLDSCLPKTNRLLFGGRPLRRASRHTRLAQLQRRQRSCLPRAPAPARDCLQSRRHLLGRRRRMC